MKVSCVNIECGKVFNSGMSFSPGMTVRMENNQSQCPYCGMMQKLPDGEFLATHDGNLMLKNQIQNLNLSTPELRQLLSVSIAASLDKITFNDYRTELSSIGAESLIPVDSKDKTSFLAFLTTIILILQMMLSQDGNKNKVTSLHPNLEKDKTEIVSYPEKKLRVKKMKNNDPYHKARRAYLNELRKTKNKD